MLRAVYRKPIEITCPKDIQRWMDDPDVPNPAKDRVEGVIRGMTNPDEKYQAQREQVIYEDRHLRLALALQTLPMMKVDHGGGDGLRELPMPEWLFDLLREVQQHLWIESDIFEGQGLRALMGPANRLGRRVGEALGDLPGDYVEEEEAA